MRTRQRLPLLLRRLAAAGWRSAGSWRLSVGVMVLAAFYHGLLAIWALSAPPQVVGNIAALAPFWLLYLLLLANTGLCLWRRLPTLARQMAAGPTLEEHPPDWRRWTGGLAVGEVAGRLRRAGWRVAAPAGGRLFGVRRRWAALGTYLFHGAFFLLALGFLGTLALRQEARVWVAEGEELVGAPEQILARTPPRLLSFGPPQARFRVLEITPELWRDQLLFTRLSADLELADGERASTRINRPLWLSWGTFLRLSGFGYALRYELADGRGRVLDSAFVKLNVFPPGRRDFFRVPGYPHRFYVQVFPDFAVVDGEPVTRSLNLLHPAVRVHAYRGRVDLGEVVLAGEGHRFLFEGLQLGFPEIRYWGELTLVGDPGAPLIFAAYLLALAGLLLKLRGGRREVLWRPGDGEEPGELLGWGGAPPGWAGEGGTAP